MSRRTHTVSAVVLGVVFVAAAAPAAASDAWASPSELWESWEAERFVTTAAPCLRHVELVELLHTIELRFPGRLRLEEVGRSYLGRPIHLLSLGQGQREVLLWSQMHGDEPSATPALLDLTHYLLANSEDPLPASILERLTLRMVPMLNPDGAESYRRRNAQAIDINRDALNLATPEGRLLKALRERHRPLLGFNLHDQGRRTTVGDSGVLATAALLAVAGDSDGTETPGRLLAMRAAAAVVEALEPFLPGGLARYDEEWNPRAFGDNLTAWGTPVVLIESGGVPPGSDRSLLVRLNFVALLKVLGALARDDLARADPRRYLELAKNRSNGWVDLVFGGGSVLQAPRSEPYRADVAVNLYLPERSAGVGPGGGCSSAPVASSRSAVMEIGDARLLGAGRQIDVSGKLLIPAFRVGIDGWGRRRLLKEESLAELARLGVGTVMWRVPQRRRVAAEALARERQGPGRPEITVTSEPLGDAAHLIYRPGGDPPPPRLAAYVDALLGTSSADKSSERLALGLSRLWPKSTASGPALRPGQRASLLVLEPESGTTSDLGAFEVSSIWLDGIEVD